MRNAAMVSPQAKGQNINSVPVGFSNRINSRYGRTCGDTMPNGKGSRGAATDEATIVALGMNDRRGGSHQATCPSGILAQRHPRSSGQIEAVNLMCLSSFAVG